MLLCLANSRLHLHRSAPLLTPLFPLPHLSPLLPVSCALFWTFLHFLALIKNVSLFFSCNSALFPKNTAIPISTKMLFPDPKFFRIRISPVRGPK